MHIRRILIDAPLERGGVFVRGGAALPTACTGKGCDGMVILQSHLEPVSTTVPGAVAHPGVKPLPHALLREDD